MDYQSFPTQKYVTWTMNSSPKVSHDQVKSLISKVCEMPWDEVEMRSRKPLRVEARFLYYFIMVSIFDFSHKAIGKTLGQDHTTVLNACTQVVNNLESKDPSYDEFKGKFHKLNSLIYKN